MKKILIVFLLLFTLFVTSCNLDVVNEFFLLGEWTWESDTSSAWETMDFQADKSCVITGYSSYYGNYEIDSEYSVSGDTLTIVFEGDLEVDYEFSIEGTDLILITSSGYEYTYSR